MTETDGPFTQVDSRPTEPSDVWKAIEAIAGARNMAPEAIDKAVRTNLQQLLR